MQIIAKFLAISRHIAGTTKAYHKHILDTFDVYLRQISNHGNSFGGANPMNQKKNYSYFRYYLSFFSTVTIREGLKKLNRGIFH